MILCFSILKIGGKKNEDSKYDQKITIAVLSAAMMLAPIVNIKAASTDVVDTSKTGSITIHKYDMNSSKTGRC